MITPRSTSALLARPWCASRGDHPPREAQERGHASSDVLFGHVGSGRSPLVGLRVALGSIALAALLLAFLAGRVDRTARLRL
jgi:hypothetical protein